MGPTTVYERSQQNGGFITGPNHRTMRNMEPQQAAAPESPAPNYREGEPGRECMSCMNYEMGQRQCNKFNFAARPQMVCDEFAEAGSAEAGDAAPMGMPEE